MLATDGVVGPQIPSFTSYSHTMSSATAACPFCNAELPPIAARGQPRTPCPRCGEPLPSERFPVQTAAAAPDRPADPLLTAKSQARTRTTLHVVLSIMAGMAAFALVFALLTQSTRRGHDFKNKSDANTQLAHNPAQLLGLGFLPKGTNLVAGLHVAALRQSKAGEVLLSAPRPEIIATMLSTVDVVGLSLDDVDHVLIGCELKDVTPHLTTVIVTRRPYDAVQIREAVKRQAFSESTYRGKTLYKLTKMPQVPKLWCADPRVLVWTTLKTDDLDRIPATAQALADTLSPATQKAMVDRLAKQSRVWAVGDLEPAKDLTDLAIQFGIVPKEQARLLALVRSFAVGVMADEQDGLALVADFYTGNPAASQELWKYLEVSTVKGATSQKAAAPPADVKDAEAQWVTWQVRADAPTLREALSGVRLRLQKDKAPR
jgi:hypothetical protein